MLSKNQIQLIKILINSNSPLFSQALSQRMNISGRSIKKNIALINDELISQNIGIRSNPGKGYWIDEEQKKQFQAFVYQQEKALIPADQNQRIIHIVFLLLKNDQTPSLRELADSFFVSKATLSEDLKFLREICNSAKGLELVTSKKGGLSIVGDEYNIRYLFKVVYYMFLASDFEYMKRCSFRYFGPSSIGTQIRDILMHELPKENVVLNDNDLTCLALMIMMASHRFLIGHELMYEGERKKHKWLLRIEKCLNIRFSENETAYYNSEFLSFLKYRKDQDPINNILNSICDSFIDSIQEDYGLDLHQEEKLKENLFSMAVYDPFDSLYFVPETTIKDHPFAYSLALRFNEMLIKNGLDHLKEKEIDSLTAALAVVLNTRAPKMKAVVLTQIEQGHRDYMFYRLRTRFSFYLDYLGIFPLYYINNTELIDKADFIICTSKHLADLPSYIEQIKRLNKEILYIDPRLDNDDFRVIEHYIHDHCPSRCGIKT